MLQYPACVFLTAESPERGLSNELVRRCADLYSRLGFCRSLLQKRDRRDRPLLSSEDRRLGGSCDGGRRLCSAAVCRDVVLVYGADRQRGQVFSRLSLLHYLDGDRLRRAPLSGGQHRLPRAERLGRDVRDLYDGLLPRRGTDLLVLRRVRRPDPDRHGLYRLRRDRARRFRAAVFPRRGTRARGEDRRRRGP